MAYNQNKTRTEKIMVDIQLSDLISIIAHLKGYTVLLDSKNIPTLAVVQLINKLKGSVN